jgi:hypothetical protein
MKRLGMRWTPGALVAALIAFGAVPGATSTAWAQSKAGQVYRCPGPPVLYTDTISAQEAKERNCRTIEGAPITVMSGPPRKPAPVAASGPRASDSKVDPGEQRSRDSEARRILQEELKREEERLAGLQAEYKGGEPDRLGGEKNYAKYQERVASLKASITRTEADIAALKRELAKLPPASQ